jgi:hypothetical protein
LISDKKYDSDGGYISDPQRALRKHTNEEPKKTENFENIIEKNVEKNENNFDKKSESLKNLNKENFDDEIFNVDDLSVNDSFNDIEINKSNKLNSFMNSNKMKNNDNEKIQNVQNLNKNTDIIKNIPIPEDKNIDTPTPNPGESSNTAYSNFLQKNSKPSQSILELSDTFENQEIENLKILKFEKLENEKSNIDHISIDKSDRNQDISMKNAQDSGVQISENKLNAFMKSTPTPTPTPTTPIPSAKTDTSSKLFTGQLFVLIT